MSGVVSMGAALGATALAASSVASVGITVGSAFAIVGAVGATLGAVGAITKVKELQYAGAALGAVGLVGGLASAAGLFGEAGALFGAAGDIASAGSQMMGGGAEMAQAASAAADVSGAWAGATAAPIAAAGPATTMGYDSSVFTAGVAGDGIDAIDMVNGIPQVNTGQVTTPTAAAPDVTPTAATDATGGTFAEGHPGVPADKLQGTFESPTSRFDNWANGGEVPPPTTQAPATPQVDGKVPDPAKSLLDMGGNQSVVPEGYGLNDQGKLMQIPPQGGGEQMPGDLGAGARNQGAPIFNDPVAPQPAATTTSASTQMPLSDMGGAQSAASGSAPSWTTNVTGKPMAGLTAEPSAWSSITDWIQKNQTLSFGAMQAIGSFITGALKPGTDPAVIDELNSRSAQNKAAENLYMQQAAMLQRRMQNMSEVPTAIRAPRPLASYGGVTGRVG